MGGFVTLIGNSAGRGFVAGGMLRTKLGIIAVALVATVGITSGALAAGASKTKPKPTGTLTVTQHFGCCAIEGTVSYVVVRKAETGERVAERRKVQPPIDTTLLEHLSVSPGRYRVITYQRFCDANCDYLDPPTLRCEVTLSIGSAWMATVMTNVEPASRCRATVGIAVP